MAVRSSQETWGIVARSLHWVAAPVIIGILIDGYWMTHFVAREGRVEQYHLHAIAGVYLALLLVIRVGWRLSERAPELPQGTPGWERLAAHAGHIGLYVLMLGVVGTGWVLWSAFGRRADVVLFGGIKVPYVHAAPDRGIQGVAEGLHLFLSYALLALVVVHVVAALRHHFIKRNTVLRRMLTGRVA